MTMHSYSGTWSHADTANFRIWGAEYNAKLALVGWVQTANTGQINWATATLPGVNTVAGYEIWRFNDSLQGTAPIYAKLEYGTLGSTLLPGMWLTVGTGTDGAGTITGIVTARRQLSSASSGTPTGGTAAPSYFCCTEGYIGSIFHSGSYQSGAMLSFIIGRFSNDDGTPNGNGFTVVTPTAPNPGLNVMVHPVWTSVRTVAPGAGVQALSENSNGGTGHYGLWPNGVSSSSVIDTGEIQTIPFWYPTKKFEQAFFACGVLNGEVPMGSVIPVALKGATTRNFMAIGSGLGYGGLNSLNDSRIAMLWE